MYTSLGLAFVEIRSRNLARLRERCYWGSLSMYGLTIQENCQRQREICFFKLEEELGLLTEETVSSGTASMTRTASIERKTMETEVLIVLNLDGTGVSRINTGCEFLDHLLVQLARYGLFDLEIRAQGDSRVDDHHTVEDVGITLGQAFKQALEERRGVYRFGSALVPLDESLSRVVVDLSNHAALVWIVRFLNQKLGNFDTELFHEWFAAFAGNAGLTLHVENLYGTNNQHIIESCFKALALALRQACALDPRQMGMVPSTEGLFSDRLTGV